MDRREQIARIIDPKGWDTFDRQMSRHKALGMEGCGPQMYVEASLAKADQIEALSLVGGSGNQELSPSRDHDPATRAALEGEG